MKRREGFIPAILVALTMVAFFAGGIGANESPRQKARYYYLEGAREAAAGNNAEAYEYYKKAYQTDSTFMDAAHSYGMQRLFVRTDTLQSDYEIKNTLGLLKKYLDENPTDQYAGQFYGYVTMRLDTVEEAIRVYEKMVEMMPEETYNLILLGDAYMMAHKKDQAIRTLEKYEASQGKSNQVSMKKMSYMLAEGDTVGALKEASELMEANPRDPARVILKGNLYELIGDNDSTLFYYTKAEDMNPDNGSVKLTLANYYREKGDSLMFDKKMYETLLSEDLQLPDKLSLLTDYLQTLLKEKGDSKRGDYLFSVILQQYPHEPEVLDLAARYEGAKGDYKEAEEAIRYAIDLDATNMNYWGQLMSYQLAADKPRDAMETFKNAKEHVKVNESMEMLYASAASQTDDLEMAEKIYGELIAEINDSLPLFTPISDTTFRSKQSYEGLLRISTLYNMLGDTYYKANEYDKAFGAYDNSLFFFPDNALTLNNYAYFLAETGGDLDKAEQMSRKALRENENNATYLDTFAWILFNKKNYKEALDYQQLALEKALEEGLDSAEFHHHLGDILFMNHRPEEALQEWEKALELEPDNELLIKKVTHKTFFFK